MNIPTGATRAIKVDLPLGRDVESISRRIELMERFLERSFHVPIINRPVGFDAIVGLLPGFGDLIGGVLGFYLLWEARNLGIPKWKMARMLGNIGVDTLLGAVPFAGNIFDFMFRSNSRNLAIIRRHLDRHHPQTRIIEQ